MFRETSVLLSMMVILTLLPSTSENTNRQPEAGPGSSGPDHSRIVPFRVFLAFGYNPILDGSGIVLGDKAMPMLYS